MMALAGGVAVGAGLRSDPGDPAQLPDAQRPAVPSTAHGIVAAKPEEPVTSAPVIVSGEGASAPARVSIEDEDEDGTSLSSSMHADVAPQTVPTRSSSRRRTRRRNKVRAAAGDRERRRGKPLFPDDF